MNATTKSTINLVKRELVWVVECVKYGQVKWRVEMPAAYASQN
jgi:hypothetical protein